MTDAQPFTGAALTAMLPPAVRLLALGEPTHGVEAFPELRNELFQHLVEHQGYRSIALESGCLAGLTADAYVTHGTGTLDDAVSSGLTHDFGASPANRELLRWMREYNEQRPAHERLHFYGFDGELETMGAASPRAALTALHDYLAAYRDLPWSTATLDGLLGADDRWSNPGAMRDPAQSVGRTPEADRLRVLTDDMRALLHAYAPGLIAATSPDTWWRADLDARTAGALLRYHAAMADTAPDRFSGLLAHRAAIMADNLDAILRREADRGPTLAFANNGHLQRDESSMTFGGGRQRWWSAGAILSSHLGDRYAFAAGNFGSLGDDVPPAGTLEGTLSALPYDRAVIDPGRLTAAYDRRTPADFTYASIDPATIDRINALIFIKHVVRAAFFRYG
ncbi:erythromycin esterase family protein [Actinoplanes aureus]|uniref:Erythromycin esterase family protein n=1 Tax=Actinoplanes aureus TaxID=2792083 RepID=A0A931C3I1_9ACTN|nr:erythromycin esterase family protein [Actinoplanes aureus]MBG0561544.1 erythromycin esterase family protein [Actinoplanes aureus]